MRQEALSAVRNPGAMEAHLPTAGSSSSQRRKQGLPQHRDAHFSERYVYKIWIYIYYTSIISVNTRKLTSVYMQNFDRVGDGGQGLWAGEPKNTI